MPLQRCKVNGKTGWQWGSRGKCYVGEGAATKALAQARAVRASGYKGNATGLSSNKEQVHLAGATPAVPSFDLKARRKPPNPLRRDPTRTLMLRKAFSRTVSKRFRQLKSRILELVVKEDVFGIKRDSKIETVVPKLVAHTRWRFRTTAQKVAEFEQWLAAELASIVGPGMTPDAYWATYIEEGYRKGAGRAFEDTRRWKWDAGEGEFYAGSKKQFLADSFAMRIAKEKVALVSGRVFTDLKGVTQDMGTRVTRVLTDGLVQGQNPRVVARLLNKEVDLGRARSLRIARTETIRAHAEGQLDALEMLGVEEIGVAVEWATSGLGVTMLGNPSPCEVCAPLQGIVMRLEEARGLLPRHPNCVTGDTLIEAVDVMGALKTNYTGEIVELVTAKGRRLSVTPNHVLLTEYGFLPARFAYQGLQVVEAFGGDPDAIEQPHDNGHVPCIADTFTALCEDAAMLSDSMPLAPEHLHGDGRSCDSEVDIVWPDRILADKLERTGIPEGPFPSFQFVSDKGPLSRLGTSTQFLHRVAFASDRSMGVRRDLLALALGCLLHADQHRVPLVACTQAHVLKPPADDRTTTPIMVRESLDGHPLLKQLSKFPLGDVISKGFGAFRDILPSLDVYPCLLEAIAHATISHAERFGDFNGRAAGAIGFDQIAGVDVVHVASLPVYDAMTYSTLYSANGIVSSNCLCSYIPANVGERTKEQKRTRTDIKRAISRSVSAEDRSTRTQDMKNLKTRWGGADTKIGRKRPEPLV